MKDVLREAFNLMGVEEFYNWLGGLTVKVGVRDLPSLKLSSDSDWIKFQMMMNRLIILADGLAEC